MTYPISRGAEDRRAQQRATIDYFAYGSNMHPLRLSARAPSSRFAFVAALAGHSLAFHKRSVLDGSGKCNIHATGVETDTVMGVVYRLDALDLDTLDVIEGVGHGYQRIEVEVVASDGVRHQVHAYSAEPSHIDDAALPFDWYHQFVLQGARHHGLPGDYIEVIEAVRCVRDDDARRREPLDALLARLPGVAPGS